MRTFRVLNFGEPSRPKGYRPSRLQRFGTALGYFLFWLVAATLGFVFDLFRRKKPLGSVHDTRTFKTCACGWRTRSDSGKRKCVNCNQPI